MEWAPIFSFFLLVGIAVFGRRVVRGRVGHSFACVSLSVAAWALLLYLEYRTEALLQPDLLARESPVYANILGHLLDPRGVSPDRIFLAVRICSFFVGMSLFVTAGALMRFVESFAPRPRIPAWVRRTTVVLLVLVGLLSFFGLRFSFDGTTIRREPTPIYYMQGAIFATIVIVVLMYLLHKSTVMRSRRRRVQSLFFSAAFLAALLLGTITGYSFPTFKPILTITTLSPALFSVVVVSGILISNYQARQAAPRSEIPRQFKPLFVRLQSEYHLTYREAQICAFVEGGCSRKELLTRLGITNGVLKLHLHSIYRKCFGPDDSTREKYHKLTVFLHRKAQTGK